MRYKHRRGRRPQPLNGLWEPLRVDFRQRFGRDPRPDDPLFWSDRSGDTPIPMTEAELEQIVRNTMERVGIDPTKRRFSERTTG